MPAKSSTGLAGESATAACIGGEVDAGRRPMPAKP